MTNIYTPVMTVATGTTIEETIELTYQYAQHISRELYRLSVPSLIPDNTQFYCGIIKHQNPMAQIMNMQPFIMLELPTQDTIPLAINADGGIIQNLLAPFVPLGYVTQAEVDNLVFNVGEFRGQQVNLYDFLPLFWKVNSKTYEQLKNDGWFRDLGY